MKAALSKLEDSAPAEIKGDVTTVFGVIGKMADVFAKYDYDTAKLATAQADFAEFTAAIQSPNFVAAGERLGTYFQQVCGIAPDAG